MNYRSIDELISNKPFKITLPPFKIPFSNSNDENNFILKNPTNLINKNESNNMNVGINMLGVKFFSLQNENNNEPQLMNQKKQLKPRVSPNNQKISLKTISNYIVLNENSSIEVKKDKNKFKQYHFQPIKKEKKVRAKICKRWSSEENEKLRLAVLKHGPKSWKKISLEIGSQYTADQCNQHWHRVLNPKIKKGDWTKIEDEILFSKVDQFGESSWTKICEFLPGRTDIQCRHRFFQFKKLPSKDEQYLNLKENMNTKEENFQNKRIKVQLKENYGKIKVNIYYQDQEINKNKNNSNEVNKKRKIQNIENQDEIQKLKKIKEIDEDILYGAEFLLSLNNNNNSM